MAELLYEEWDCELVISSHSNSKKIYYRIFWGTVNWDRSTEGMEVALTTLIQNGNTADFKLAKKNNEINFQMPAHILKNDIPELELGIQRLLARVKAKD
jgi:hypothetical protein